MREEASREKKKASATLRRFLLALYCVAFVVTRVVAGDPPLPPIRYIGIEHGLSNNAVTGVYQDYKGFMWFTTYDGLNRYDGNSFTIFRNRIGDSTSLRGNEIYTIAGDKNHNLWIGGRNGVSVYHPAKNTFSPVRYRSLSDNQVREVSFTIPNIMAGRDEMLIATEKGGLLIFSGANAIGSQAPLQTGKTFTGDYSVPAITIDGHSGQVWLFLQNIGLCKYSVAGHRVTIVDDHIRQGNCLRVDDNGNIWVGNDNGLFKYDVASGTYSNSYVEGGFKISNLFIDDAGVLWIASDGKGVLLLERGAARARPFASPDGKPLVNSSAVYGIYEDHEGRKWIGTLRGGVNIVGARTNPIRTAVYNTPNIASPNPNNDFVLSFCEDALHNVWIGTDGGGLRYWDRHEDRYTQYTHDPADPGSVAGNFVTGILRDEKDEIWISAWFGGISRWERGTRRFRHYDCLNPNTHSIESRVWLLYEDRNKTIWASTSNDGTLYTLNREKDRFELYDSNIVNVQCLAEDKAGNLWGGDYSSLIRIDKNGKHHRRYPLGFTVRSIHEDAKGNFWIGTQGGGLLLMDRDKGTFRRFDDRDGLRSNSILRILEDRNGNLWMSTFDGLLRYDAHEQKFRNFSVSDGLQSNQFSFNAALALQSGEFLFGGIKGFNIFYPDSVESQAPAPPVYLTDLRMGDKTLPVEGLDRLTVPYDKAALTFSFVAPEYSAPDKIQYAYYLKGWDKNWNYSNTVRTATYSRLQEGTYEFLIKATNAVGKWGEPRQVMTIVVSPPWYRSWWAYCLYTLAVLGVVYIYIRYTRRQERLRYEIMLAHLENEKDKELNEKKLSFFTNVSHEFRTPLTLIINPLKQAVSDQEKKGSNRDLTIAYRNARRLLSLVDQLLLFRKADSGADMLKISKVEIGTLAYEVFQCFLQQARQKSIDYQYDAAEDLPSLYADREKLEIALFNLLSNAFKYTPDGGLISLRVERSEGRVLIVVEDSGVGIPAENRDLIFQKFRQADPGSSGSPAKTGFGIGLYLVKQFVEAHKGTVSCSSRPGHGTVFTLNLKQGSAHLPPHRLLEDKEVSHELLDELTEEPDPMPVMEAPAESDQGRKAEETITDKRSLLLIDDNAGIREYLQHIFSEKYILYVAADGAEGFRLAQEHLPDCIISDINMQGMDGLTLCQGIKSSETLGHIPVILLTGETGPEMRLKGIEGGADDYVTKPFDSGLLMARVETILKNRNLLQRYFFDSITLRQTSIKAPAEYQDFLRHCIEIIEKNIDTEDFTTQKFAREMGMSRSALYQKVKSISGQSLNAFVRSIRLRRAAVLMLRENMNVNQAAFQVGIGDARYFREQFVKLFEMTPSEYIRRYRGSFNRDFNIIRPEE